MHEEETRTATEAEAHVEWHLNSGVPMGTPGCPQDACHGEPEEYDDGSASLFAVQSQRPPTEEEMTSGSAWNQYIREQEPPVAPPEETHWEHEMVEPVPDQDDIPF